MANFRRKKPRCRTYKHTSRWLHRSWPSYWDRLYHTRPRRRDERAALVKLMQGADPDGIVWPLGNRKPHIYYW